MQNGEKQWLFPITSYGFLTSTFIFYEKVLSLLKLDGEGPRVSACMEPALGERGLASVSCRVLGRAFPMTQSIAFPAWPPRSVPFQRLPSCDAGHRTGARAWLDRRRVGQDRPGSCCRGDVLRPWKEAHL